MNLSNEQIARILGVPSSRVAALWPLIDLCLASLAKDEWTDYGRIAALGTLRVECPPFAPVRERFNGIEAEYFKAMYWDNEHVREELGNRTAFDAVRFYGRGPIQLTGYANYKMFGDLIGVDLVSDPDKALEINTAAALFAAYFFTHKRCLPAANAFNWIRVREIVNGGHNGMKAFLLVVQMLGQAAGLEEVSNSAGAQFKKIRDLEATHGSR